MFPKGVIWGIIGLVLIFVISFGYFLYVGITAHFESAVTRNLDQFQAGVTDLKNFDPRSAEQKFSAANDDLQLTFSGFISKLAPLFKNTGELVGGFQKLAGLGTSLTREVAFFEEELLPDFIGKKGVDIIAHLETTRDLLSQIRNESDVLSSNASNLERLAPGASSTFSHAYFPLRLDAANLEKFLGALIGWLTTNTPRPASGGEARPASGGRHVLVMFQNPSEMRPAGGFLGSYADITVDQASLEGIIVRDIADADRTFTPNIIPPKPLQAEVTRMRPADANWFFDFSKSAAETIRFMESSTLYAASSATSRTGDGEGVKFDGAIAVSPRVIGDLLATTGPINLSASRVTLDQNNFLEVLQAKVQAGQAQNASYPKGVLRELSSALLDKLSQADSATKKKLFALMRGWLAKKDIMLFFKDQGLESFFEEYGAAGTTYVPPSNFEGDYLAIVDANINGGKSDLFVTQTVTLQSQLGASGTVTDHLVIDRNHQGDTSNDWWYKVPNQDYLQVFVPSPSTLVNFSGGSAKAIPPPINYANNGYSTDPLVALIESSTQKIFNYPAVSTHNENGMQVFSTWSKINAGEKTEIIFDYSHRLFSEIADGTHYQFVFEKQAGTNRDYAFDISAPVGFRFKENGLPVYEYKSNDPPGRLILNLTLEKT